MRPFILLAARSHEEVALALKARGFARNNHSPREGARRFSGFLREESAIAFVTDALSGGGALCIGADDGDGALPRLVAEVAPVETPSQLLSRMLREERPAARVRGILLLGFALALDNHGLETEPLAAFARQCLFAPEHGLRAATIEVILGTESALFDSAVTGIGEARPELAWVEETWQRIRREAAERERQAEIVSAKEARRALLGDLVAREAYAEALTVADELMESEPASPSIWRARAVSLAALGNTWPAAFAAATWLALGGERDAELLLQSLPAEAPRDGEPPVSDLMLALCRVSTDGAKRAAAALALASRPSGSRVELGYLYAVLALADAPNGKASGEVLPYIEAFVERHPAVVEGHKLLGYARFLNDDEAGALAAHRAGVSAVASAASLTEGERKLARFKHDLQHGAEPYEAPDALSVWKQAWYACQADARRALSIQIVDEALALPFDAEASGARAARSELLAGRALKLTALLRHDEAIAAYRRAIAETPAGGGSAAVLRFNLACELAKQGAHDEALEWLRDAAQLDAYYAQAAREDDYFAGLFDSDAFFLATTSFDEPPTAESAAEKEQAARVLSYDDDEDALDGAHEAVAAALIVGDEALLARALLSYASMLCDRGSPARGLSVVRRAVALAEQRLPELEQATFKIRLGDALLQSVTDSDVSPAISARAEIEAALVFREKHLDPSNPQIASALSELARVELVSGNAERAVAVGTRAIALFDAHIAQAGESASPDVLVDRAIALTNHFAHAKQAGAAWSELVAIGGSALTSLEALQSDRIRLPGGLAARLRLSLARAAMEVDGADAQTTGALLERALRIEYPDPRVREVKLYFARLAAGVHDLKGQGYDDAWIANGLSSAVRAEALPSPMDAHPAFANLAVEFARRLTARTNLVMVAMALETAKLGGEPVEAALKHLEEFAVANAEGYEEEDS